MNPRLTPLFALVTMAASGLLLAQAPPPSSTPNSPESVAEQPTPPASDHSRSPSTDSSLAPALPATQPGNQATAPNAAADAQIKSCMARERAQNAALSDQQLARACTGTSPRSK